MRFLIVDDHPIMRLGVRQLIERAWPDAEIDEAQGLEAAAAAFTRRPADLVVLDLSLPDATGLEAPTRMLRVARGVPILVLSLSAESTHAQRLLQMGISGYLPKGRAADELVVAMKRLLDGHRYLTPEMADRLIERLDVKQPDALPHEQLSRQEYRLMQLIAAGHTPAEIARIMSLSVKTVGSYRARVLAKCGWSNNIELTKYCVQHGLTDP
jgi:two-component system invasion response regulator UvrY